MSHDRPIPARRVDESIGAAARREAIDAVYYERDHGGDMHTAGAAAADAVLHLVAAAEPDLWHAVLRAWDRAGMRASRRSAEAAVAAVLEELAIERSDSPTSGGSS